MSISQALLPEFDQEMASTRKTLERIPEDKLTWKPHEKSMPLGRLAGHVVEMVGWAVDVMNKDEFDFRPAGAPPMQPMVATSQKQVLEAFDKIVPAARAAIAASSDENFMKSWALKSAGQTLFSMPKAVVMRTFVMNHVIHHRAQLGVYLRMNDIAVPAIYGPSADEGNM
jgi:uncharacterized damage-inducible protein DinB